MANYPASDVTQIKVNEKNESKMVDSPVYSHEMFQPTLATLIRGITLYCHIHLIAKFKKRVHEVLNMQRK